MKVPSGDALNWQSYLDHAKSGDRAALGRLLDELKERLVRQSGREAADQSDIVQQSMLSACRVFNRFDGDQIGQFIEWLDAIHRRNLIDAGRRRARQPESSPIDPAAQQTSASRRLIRLENSSAVRAALDQLPETQRLAIELRYMRHEKLDAICQELGKTPLAVAGLLKRGLKRLKELLPATEFR